MADGLPILIEFDSASTAAEVCLAVHRNYHVHIDSVRYTKQSAFSADEYAVSCRTAGCATYGTPTSYTRVVHGSIFVTQPDPTQY